MIAVQFDDAALIDSGVLRIRNGLFTPSPFAFALAWAESAACRDRFLPHSRESPF